MPYRIAGIDVHKKMLAVVIADSAVEAEYQFTQRRVGTSPRELRDLAEWLVAQEVEEVVMESTAQYWRPVWEALERCWQPRRRQRAGGGPLSGTLHLAQAQSNRAPSGRKKDFLDAERLVKRLVAQELTLSFVPDAAQRLWRTVMRRKYQVTRNRVQVQNRLECLMEEAHLKLSSLVSDLLGLSARRMLQAIADGETDATKVAALADSRLRATPDQLSDALGACADLHPVYRRLITMTLEDVRRIDEQIDLLDREMAGLLRHHQAAVQRLAAVPGLGVDSGQQIIAEVGPHGGDIPLTQAPRLVGGGVSRRRGERGRQLQPPLAEGQSADASPAQSGRQRGGENQRQHLRAGLPPAGSTPWARAGDWRDRPSSLSTHLEDPAPGRCL
jgi:transposase